MGPGGEARLKDSREQAFVIQRGCRLLAPGAPQGLSDCFPIDTSSVILKGDKDAVGLLHSLDLDATAGWLAALGAHLGRLNSMRQSIT
jgi:hypothetical protein